MSTKSALGALTLGSTGGKALVVNVVLSTGCDSLKKESTPFMLILYSVSGVNPLTGQLNVSGVPFLQ